MGGTVSGRLTSLRKSLRLRSFYWLERHGWHAVRMTPTDPIVDTRTLTDLEQREFAMPGVDLRVEAQLELLERFRALKAELVELGIPRGMGGVDIEVMYGVLRLYPPKRFVEIMHGTSTRVAARLLDNEGGEPRVIVVDPDAAADLAADPRVEVRRQDVRDVPVSWFRQLEAGDVLFIDTSHVLRTGSDVQYLVLEVLPSLPVGVLVHVNDIFWPREYPRYWFDGLRFANEQYVLQAFLAFNNSFEVLWSTGYLHHHHRDRLAEVFACYDPTAEWQGGGLWLRRVR